MVRIRKEIVNESKLCAVCGAEFFRGEWDRLTYQWNKRQTCTENCAHALSRKKRTIILPSKTCEVCGKLFDRHENEAAVYYDRRRTCGISCGRKLAWQSDSRRDEASQQSRAKNPRSAAPAPKNCQACGGEFARRDDETNTSFLRRVTCSRPCADVLTARGLASPDLSPKLCSICGSLFFKRDRETNRNFQKRETCGTECGLTLRGQRRNEPIIERACIECGVILERRFKEPPSAYAGRLTCSRSCQAIRMRRLAQGDASLIPLRYALTWTHELREAIRERDGRQCVICGGTEGRRKLPVHHIDYDKQNCRPVNLVTLCHSCHPKTTFDRDYWRPLLTSLVAEMYATTEAEQSKVA